MSPLRLESFKNSEVPRGSSESEGKTPPVLREGERGMPEIPDSWHSAAPLDDSSRCQGISGAPGLDPLPGRVLPPLDDESPDELHTRILLRLESIFLGRTS